jgi:enamine deaminase RidA (YjgF/YER057c/UK114 family)
MNCCSKILKTDSFRELSVKDFKHSSFQFKTITVNFLERVTGSELSSYVGELLREYNVSPVLLIVSGGIAEGVDSILNEMPTIWIKGDQCHDEFITSLQLIGSSVKPTYHKNKSGRCTTAYLSDQNGEYAWFGNIIAQDISLSRAEQTKDAFTLFNRVLNEVGMKFIHVARTWIYLDQLLDWYDDFNVLRTEFFNQEDVFNHLVPASTGIGACNVDGSAIIMGGFANLPKGDHATVVAPVLSPLQCPAWDYKSSFSRAISVTSGSDQQIMISGTASIEPGGLTVHLDDIENQIELTMKVIDGMLQEVDMSFADVTRATAYCKEACYLSAFKAWLEKNNLAEMPVAFSHADVCRHDLLFEVELDAASSK